MSNISQNLAPVTFFIVEDDDLDYKTLTRTLQRLRISNPVRRAFDGLEALEILRGANGQERMEPPFMILLDLKMPRMGGLEFLQELRSDEDLRKSIVFVLSSSDSDGDILASYDMSVAGYIKKTEPGEGFENAISMIDHYWRVVEFPRT